LRAGGISAGPCSRHLLVLPHPVTPRDSARQIAEIAGKTGLQAANTTFRLADRFCKSLVIFWQMLANRLWNL
jgi:hypothetical protein